MSKSTKSRPAKTPVVTAESLICAAKRSIRAVCKSGCIRASTDAGFLKITGKHPNRSGYQVFVVVEPWSDEALIEFPDSGGLINRARDIVLNRAREAVLKSHERLIKERADRRRKRISRLKSVIAYAMADAAAKRTADKNMKRGKKGGSK